MAIHLKTRSLNNIHFINFANWQVNLLLKTIHFKEEFVRKVMYVCKSCLENKNM